MRHKALTLAVVTLLAFGASGVVAASIAPSPPAATADQSPADTESPAKYTVEVIDPHDRLSERTVENVRELAWANEKIKNHFDDKSVHFHIQAVGEEDDLSIYVAPSNTAEPQVKAVVDLESKSVVAVTEVNTAGTAGTEITTQVAPFNASEIDPGEAVTVEGTCGSKDCLDRSYADGREFRLTSVDGTVESDTFSVLVANEAET